MYLTLDHRLAFIHIPKTAGETIYWKLHEWFRNGLHIAFWGQDKPTQLDLTHLHQHVLYDYVGERLYCSCQSFAVVRNPYDRFYSAFGDIPSKIVYSRTQTTNPHTFWVDKYKAYGNPKVQRGGKWVWHDDPTRIAQLFDAFCDVVEQQDIANDTVTKHNIHLVPQHKFIFRDDGTQNVSQWVKYEELDTAMPKLWKQFGVSQQPKPKPKRRTRRSTPPRRGGKRRRRQRSRRAHAKPPSMTWAGVFDRDRLRKSYVDKFTPRALALVERLYAADFERFGYRKQSAA